MRERGEGACIAHTGLSASFGHIAEKLAIFEYHRVGIIQSYFGGVPRNIDIFKQMLGIRRKKHNFAWVGFLVVYIFEEFEN